MLLAAVTDSDTAQSNPPKISLVFRIFEISIRLRRIVAGTQTQVFSGQVSIHNLSRIHFPVWIPNGFELAECFNQLGSEHFWQELGFRLTIAMLSGKRASVAHHQIRGLAQERMKRFDAIMRLEVKVDP